MPIFLFLSSAVSWGQAYVCDPATPFRCTIDPVAAIPGGPSVLAHVRVENISTGTSTCWVNLQTSLGTEAPTVQILNSPPPSQFIAPGGGVIEFDVELAVDATTDATIGKKIRVEVSNEWPLCRVEQWLCIVPESETTFSMSAPPAASGFTAVGNGGWASVSGKEPMHDWGAELQPTTADFTGRKPDAATAETERSASSRWPR